MIQSFKLSRLLIGVVLCDFLVPCFSSAVHAKTAAEPSVIEAASGDRFLFSFQGRVFPERFLKVKGIGYGHHAIVWKEGGAAKKALIETDLSDKIIADRLEEAGVMAGNNLNADAWKERNDRSNSAADARVRGDSLKILVTWNGSDHPKSLQEVVGLADAEYLFGDHRDLIPIWKSGCVVCNVSCPGGRISNQTMTIRDQVDEKLDPKIEVQSLPPDGTTVMISLYATSSNRNHGRK